MHVVVVVKRHYSAVNPNKGFLVGTTPPPNQRRENMNKSGTRAFSPILREEVVRLLQIGPASYYNKSTSLMRRRVTSQAGDTCARSRQWLRDLTTSSDGVIVSFSKAIVVVVNRVLLLLASHHQEDHRGHRDKQRVERHCLFACEGFIGLFFRGVAARINFTTGRLVMTAPPRNGADL